MKNSFERFMLETWDTTKPEEKDLKFPKFSTNERRVFEAYLAGEDLRVVSKYVRPVFGFYDKVNWGRRKRQNKY